MSAKIVSPHNNSSISPNTLNISGQFQFLMPDDRSCRNFSPFVINQLKSPSTTWNISPIIGSAETSSFLKKRQLKERREKIDTKRRRRTFSSYSNDVNQIMEMTLSVKTVLKDLDLTQYTETFDKEELFRKLSLKSPSESSNNEYKAKYQPQKNHSITISPSSNGLSRKKRLNHKNKRDSTRHKKSTKNDDLEDDDDFTVPDRKRQSYIKSCIKKRLNNNYEKQINCIQDENVVFTDNKIYISLSARNSSLGSNNSLKKNRRIIYPTSGPCKLNGFLRHYDFSYDDEPQESPARSSKENNTSATNNNNNNMEKLKFDMMNEELPPTCLSTNTLDNVVFEKVRMKPCCSSNNYDSLSSYIHVTNDNDRNDDSILTNSTFMTSYAEDDSIEDDIQWKNFLELRKHGKPINNNVCQLNDSGFGSQLFITTTPNNNNNNMRTLETWQDDETYDNSFNEELEQRVSIMFPDLYKASSQSAHFNNINNMNHVTAEKLS